MQDVKARFAALKNGSLTLAQASGAQRAERLRGILSAVLKNKQRFYDAAHVRIDVDRNSNQLRFEAMGREAMA